MGEAFVGRADCGEFWGGVTWGWEESRVGTGGGVLERVRARDLAGVCWCVCWLSMETCVCWSEGGGSFPAELVEGVAAGCVRGSEGCLCGVGLWLWGASVSGVCVEVSLCPGSEVGRAGLA